MYGSSGKSGGRGRAAGPVKRPPSTFPLSRPLGAGRGGGGGSGNRRNNNTPYFGTGFGAGSSGVTVDETFSLVRNRELNFGMIIKLSPELVDEIKRIEAEGGSAKIKFDSQQKNAEVNVIDVGGKVFGFSWAEEKRDLCDIYEEQRSGDDGNGLLVERGVAWRKLQVNREFNDSYSNKVKRSTLEADIKHRSRKTVSLDPGNPSMKNQIKAFAAAEVNNSWKGSYSKKKEPPFKKMKTEPSSAPPKPVGKAGLSSSAPSKARASASPLLFTPEQSGVAFSPYRNNNHKVHAQREDTSLTNFNKENASTPEKEMLSRLPPGTVQNKQGSNERFGNKHTDLESLLISLLMEKPQGMNIKALEIAVGEIIPRSVKQIEPILKKIAVLQAPGRYTLKPDVELESFKKALPENGSSLENNNHHREPTATASTFPSKSDDVKQFEEPTDLNFEPYEELNTSENIDIEHHSPDISSDKRVPDNSQVANVSSESGSSDSESDSGSDSESDSGSGSDDESNSKQGSDEEVDIMSDDDKESEQKSLHVDTEVGFAHNMVDEKDGSDYLELEKELFEDNQEAEMPSFPDKDGDDYADESTNLLINHLEHHESDFYSNDVHNHKNVSKRGSDVNHFEENEHAKRLKSGNWPQPSISRSPNWASEGPHKGTTNQMIGRPGGDVSDYHYEKVDNREFSGNHTLDSPRSGPISIDLNAHAKAPADMENTFRYSEMGPQLNDVYLTQKDNKAKKEVRDEDSHYNDKRPPKNSKLGDDGSRRSGSHQKKHGSSIRKSKDTSIDNYNKSPVINGRGPTLRRELSDLEMGELRESAHEEASGAKKRFEKNNSFKQSENMSSSEYWNLDESKGKPAGIGGSTIPQNLPKKIVPDDHVDDVTRFNGKPVPRRDHVKGKSQHNKVPETSNKERHLTGSEGYTDNQRNVSRDVVNKHEKQVVPLTTKDKKRHKSKDVGGKKKDPWQVDSRDSGQKREMGSFSDDSITSYTKYEKDEPEMKGPIKDLSQYNEYVQEYHEKYDCYKELNKILESYRNNFQIIGRELELAKGRDNDKYNKVLEQLMESYRECGTKNRRLKKIFVVLHHELQHLKEMIRDFAEKQTKG